MGSSPEKAVAVLFDSNFLMTAARLHFDLFHSVEESLDSPFERRILSTNLRELRSLARHSAPITRKDARTALKLAESCMLVELTSEDHDPDEVLLQFAADSPNLIVATNDAALRIRLRKAGCPVLYFRRNGKLDFLGYEP